MLPNRLIDTARVAATYTGTIIGAGFASGQEIVQFFVSYGQLGLAGIFLASCLFAWLGGELLHLGHRLRATAYHQAIYHLCGYRLGVLLDLSTAGFLFATLAIMLAGGATVLYEYFGLPYNFGLACAGLIVILVVLCGVKGIANANLVVTPILVVSIISISAYSLYHHNFNLTMLEVSSEAMIPPSPHWLLSSLLYASYNLMISSTVMVPLGGSVPDRQTRFLGGMLGGCLLGFLAVFLAVVIMIHYPGIMIYDVPLLYLANIQYPLSGMFYALTLLAAMFTTAIAGLFGCTGKVQAVARVKPAIAVSVITIAALICGQFGFANLIRLLFPIFGYATLCFTVRLAWLSCRGSR